MPVTFSVADVSPRDTGAPEGLTNEALLAAACPAQSGRCKGMFQCSVTEDERPRLIAEKNGFVHAVMQAYAGHHHLRIRPDDVWMAILCQLSFYVNAHAEELRHYFVPHEGQKPLIVETMGSRYSIDYGALARAMTRQIHENVVDKTLVEWVLPDFSTTTVKDTTICSVFLMSTLKEAQTPPRYFRYTFRAICGIPSVTLDGTKSDWQRLLDRLDRLPTLGDEPAAWAAMLRPILRRFVRAFDGAPDVAFWAHVVHRMHVMCGRDEVSGWLAAFCVWSPTGKWQGRIRGYGVARPSLPVDGLAGRSFEPLNGAAENEEGASVAEGSEAPGSVLEIDRRTAAYTLDGIRYPTIDMREVPAGYCEVDVIVDDNGIVYDCMMVAGHVAVAATASEPGGAPDTLAPAPQWFIFEKKEPPPRPSWRW
ncbi:hypothetical protein OH77DRAFT_1589515 [Trametes cingulata]|nr:hypothetical protein OH77DRAFT_1589515 [Trametes cingulata]